MKLTLFQIDQAYQACKKLKDEKFNIKMAYKILKLYNILEQEVNNYEKIMRDLVLKYCEKDENGEPKPIKTEQGEGVSIQLEYIDLFNKESAELGEIEIEIKDDYIFNVEDFDNLVISLAELSGLFPFIVD